MLTFIAFGFKLCFSAAFGGILSYVPGKANGDVNILYSSLLSVLGASLISLSSQYPKESSGIMSGFSVLAIILMIIILTKEMTINIRLIFIFSSVVGMIVGYGLILQASLLVMIIYGLKTMGPELINSIESLNKDELIEE